MEAEKFVGIIYGVCVIYREERACFRIDEDACWLVNYLKRERDIKRSIFVHYSS